ncbi:MAG: CHAT domain-containing protein [Pyrinomonadaceae bacterium]|nr:CHAT domain-containing protein [Pyrinomonadaceae bacterium]
MGVKSLFLFCFVLLFVQIGFGQKVKSRQQPTPIPKQKKLNEKQKEDLLNKINQVLEQGGEKFKQQTPDSIRLSLTDFYNVIKLIDSVNGQLGTDGKVIKAVSIFSIGIAYNQLNETQNSIKSLESALKIFREIKSEDEFPALTLKVLGENYQKINQPQKASEDYLEAIALYRNLIARQEKGEKLSVSKIEFAEVLVASVESLLLIGQKNAALEFSTEAASIFKEFDKPLEMVNAINRIGRINLEIGNTQESLKNFTEALTILRNEEVQKLPKQNVKQLEAICLNNLGNVNNVLGNKVNSNEYYQQALKLADEINFVPLKPVLLLNLGIYQMEKGNYSEAVDFFNNSQHLAIQNGDLRTQAIALNNLGACLTELGNYQKATEFWEKGLEVSTKINDIETTAKIVINSGGALIELGNLTKALEMIEIGKKYFEVSNNKPGLASIYTLLARIYEKQDDRFKALENAKKGLGLSKETNNERLAAQINLFLASIYKEQKDLANASKFYFAALQDAQKINEIVIQATSLLGLSSIQSELNNPSVAIVYGKKSVNQFQNLRGNIKNLDKETQQILLENISIAYQHLADLLISVGRIAEAEQVLALLKEEELYEYVRRDDKVARELTAKLSLTDEENAAFKRYNEFSENIAAIGKEYSELEAEKRQLPPNQPFTKQARFEELGKKLKDATEVFLKFLDELKVEFGEENSRVAQVDSGLQAMLKEMKARDTVVISTIASPERLNIILTTDSIQKAYTVDIKAADLNKLVADFRKVVQNPGIDPRPLGQKLYNILVKPLEKDLADSGAKTLVWSLDGTLRYVPISALWDGKKYLAENYANAVITLASRDKLKDIPSDKSNWKTVGFGVSKSATIEETEAGSVFKRQFDSLPSVPEELCRIVNDNDSMQKCLEKGIINGRRFLDEQFTLNEFKNEMGKFPLVHIASHFSLKAGNDKNSYLLLGGGDERRLTIAELNRSNSIFVGVELLTLSACNTAMTGEKKANGVEIEGFGAIAQKQGAKSVLATLWAVADPSTRDLMNEFYTFLSQQKLTKAESLRQAQIKLIYGKYSAEELQKKRSDLAGQISDDSNQTPFQKDENRPFAHPFYWSPFVLMGNWQ